MSNCSMQVPLVFKANPYRVVGPPEHLIFDQIMTPMICKTIIKHFDKYYEADKAARAIDNRLFSNDNILAPIAPIFQAQTRDPLTDQKGSPYLVSSPWKPLRKRTKEWKQRPPCARNIGSNEYKNL